MTLLQVFGLWWFLVSVDDVVIDRNNICGIDLAVAVDIKPCLVGACGNDDVVVDGHYVG